MLLVMNADARQQQLSLHDETFVSTNRFTHANGQITAL